MKRLFRLGLLAILLAVPVSAFATTPHAVIVGVGQFDDKQILPRPTAEADAKALAKLFADEQYLGISKENLHVLTGTGDDGTTKATRENILEALDKAVNEAENDDLLLIFLVGQGASAIEDACFFATDSVFTDRAKTAILPKDLTEIFKKLKSRNMLVALDINYKGFEAKEGDVVLEPSVLSLVRGFIAQEENEEGSEPDPFGRAVILGNQGVASTVGPDHGVFTMASLEALKGKADTSGYEPDGNVDVDELRDYLEKRVPVLARQFGESTEQKEQLPFVGLASASHFVITHNPEVYPKVQAQLKALAELNLPEEVAEQGQELLGRMPKLDALKDLRKAYQSLVEGKIDKNAFLTKRTDILDGMKLDRDAARKYAADVYRGAEEVADAFIKELDPGELIAAAIEGMYRRLEVELPKDLEPKLSDVKGKPRRDLLELLTEARVFLGKREDLAGDKAADLSLRAMMAKLDDPYSNYIDRQQDREMSAPLTGGFTGIGIQIRRDLARDGLLVVSPIKGSPTFLKLDRNSTRGSPAYEAGLRAGDLITSIIRDVDDDGKSLKEPEVITTKGMKVSDAVRKIIGHPGTTVKLTVTREGVKEPITFKLTRNPVQVESVLGWKRASDDDEWKFMMDPENKIGYIRLTQFTQFSYPDILRAMEQLKKEGMQALIFDMRFNPGGYLDSAVKICDLFIDDGLIVTIRPRVGQEQAYTGQSTDSQLDFPMAVLVNGGSASGSEIVAACLQDHGRAVVIGSRSFGKGSVQNIMPFTETKGKIKMTTATFWRPSDKNLNKSSTKGTDEEDWGVRPNSGFDIKLSREEQLELEERLRDAETIKSQGVEDEEEKKPFEDTQLKSAVEYLREQLKLAEISE